MGLMDKLRSMAAVVTGGGAKVQVEAVDPSKDGPFTVNVQAEIGEGDLKIEKVYVKLMGVETVKLEIDVPAEPEAETEAKAGTESTASEKPAATKKEISKTAQTHLQEFELAEAQTLSANQTYTWSGEIQLPADGKPVYQGVNATHEWKILAGLSAFGNDPDSGWQVIEF